LKIIVFGSGQIGNVVASILREQDHEILGFIDDDPESFGKHYYGLPVLGPREYLLAKNKYDAVCLGVGTIKARVEVLDWLDENAVQTVSAIHSSAVISPEANLGRNLVVGASTTFYVNPVIGDGCYIGPSVTVSHDTIVGKFCLLSVGSVVGARCDLEDEVFVGSSSTIMPPSFGSSARLRVGKGAVIGVGSTVIHDVPMGITVIGTPAKPLKKKVK
jgi:sugar O-acyltransferase (sialic acid O-acetyltransferase NeuD family)